MRRKLDRTRLRLRGYKQRIRAIRTRRPRQAGRVRMRNFGVQKKRSLLVVPLLIALIALAGWVKSVPIVHAHFRPTEVQPINPLMGWAVDAATDPDMVELEHSLVYATLTWRELEPEEGVFDFEAFEKRNHLAEWWTRGKRLVLRFVMDRPGEQSHRDIPDWLYKQMGEDAGADYAYKRGRGFSPNYSNLLLMERHLIALKALGARYDGHQGVAFVELGSLGHNGAWTVEGVKGDWGMPPASDIKTYVWCYTNAFPSTTLLAPAPYQAIRLTGLGLYNERLGNEERTWRWLDTIEYGGYDPEVGAEFRAMADFPLSRVSGARIDGKVNQALLFTRNADNFVRQLEANHATYVSGVQATGLSEAMSDGLSVAVSGMGYRLWVREASWPQIVRAGYRLNVDLEMRNDGAQAMTQAWPMELSILRDGRKVASEISKLDTRALTPGRHRLRLRLDLSSALSGEYQLAMAILDPITMEPAVHLAMQGEQTDLRSVLGTVTVVR